MMKIFLVAGARPNFMKIAPIIRALKVRADESIEWKTVHTGQHYDFKMSAAFFEDLEIPKPEYFLEAGSGTHAEQTARIMTAFEKVCIDDRPDIVLVVGDVNSTIACSIVAKKLVIDVAHVEAGLRSFDLTMPEEINRMVTDSITDYFFVTERTAIENLRREGKPVERIYFVGHVMIDNLFYQKSKLDAIGPGRFPTANLKNELKEYIFLTLHRPSNVDNQSILTGIINSINRISNDLPIIFPVHPRTRKMVDALGLKLSDNIKCIDPLGFMEALFLWMDASVVITDSGGLQEETTGLGVPCFTIRENTERPITIEEGTNTLLGNSPEKIIEAFETFKAGYRKKGTIPELWDGKASERIVDILIKNYKI